MALILRISLLLLATCIAAKAAAPFGGLNLSSPAFVGRPAAATGGGGADPVFNTATHVWHLEEAAGNARVDSKGSLNLSEVASVSQVAGKHSNAAELGELDSGSWTEPGTWTICFWIKMISMTGGDNLGIISKSDGGVTWGISLSDIGSTTQAGGVHFDGTVASLDFTTTINAGAWYFVTAIQNATTIKLSVNGASLQSAASASAPGSGTMQIADLIGTQPFDLDEVYFFSSELTQGNITTLYNSGAGLFYSP